MSDERKTQELSDDDFILEARLHPSQEPVAAHVVSDGRDRLGKRLAVAAFAMLLLFFVINTFVQSSQNGELLRQARADRTRLAIALERQSNALEDVSETNVAQSRFIFELQKAIREQNDILERGGFPTVRVPEFDAPDNSTTDADVSRQQDQPNDSTSENRSPRDSSDREPTSSRDPDPKPDRRPDRDPDPEPRPSPRPEPDPPTPVRDTVDEVRDRACELTGVCP